MSPQTADSLKASTVDVNDLLCGIISSLSRIRGSQSYLFSRLLQQSQGLLGLDDILQPLLLRPALPEETADKNYLWDMLPGKGPLHGQEVYQDDDVPEADQPQEV